MPTYDYKCLNCGHLFEQFQRITEPPIEVCPECGGNVKRLIGSGAPPIFKGNGFYHTDYKVKSDTNKNVTKPSTTDNKNVTDKK